MHSHLVTDVAAVVVDGAVCAVGGDSGGAAVAVVVVDVVGHNHWP